MAMPFPPAAGSSKNAGSPNGMMPSADKKKPMKKKKTKMAYQASALKNMAAQGQERKSMN